MTQLHLFQDTLYTFRIQRQGVSYALNCACRAAHFARPGDQVHVKSWPRPDWYDTPQCGCMAGFNLKTFNTTE
jgi:hypothetical protein